MTIRLMLFALDAKLGNARRKKSPASAGLQDYMDTLLF